jgi:leucyl/phenylalanyl-tRNA---protein transferase
MPGLAPYRIPPHDTSFQFPDVRLALKDPDGLLALGGDLSPERLTAAYRHGVFPWYSDDQPILWWSPNPRSVLQPDGIKISRSLRKTLRKALFSVTFDQAFADVVEACSQPRGTDDHSGTWITDEMKQGYLQLHQQGVAHSVECWRGDSLVGGLYGVALGAVFFGESMFSRQTDASKVAFVRLAQQLKHWDYALIDCQIQSQHLDSLGAHNISRDAFSALLAQHCEHGGQAGVWPATPPLATHEG